MTKLGLTTIASIATGFFGAALVLGCLAAAPATQGIPDKLAHTVKLGTVSPQSGDKISVEEVRGTSDTLSAGNTYEVAETYKLVSQDKAVLVINVTAERSKSIESHPTLADQKMVVERGEGHFTLRFHMWQDGNPHASFYPAHGGESFASAYF